MEHVLRGNDSPRLVGGDTLKIETVKSMFSFEGMADKGLADRLRHAINQMGGAGEHAEKCYQQALDGLARHSKAVVAALSDEYDGLPVNCYLERWSLVHLMAELMDETALDFIDRQLSNKLPEELSPDPHAFTSVGEEIMILTTAVEAATRMAAEGSDRAREVLLRHVGHTAFSVKRAAIQGYVAHGGEHARDMLGKVLAERDHYILDIRRTDVRQVHQAEGGLFLAQRDKTEVPALTEGGSDACETPKGKPDTGCNC